MSALRRRVQGIRGFLSTPNLAAVLSTDSAARLAVPGLQQGMSNRIVDYAALCRTLDGYRFNTIFEELGAAAFDLIIATEIEDLKPRGIYNPVPPIVDFYANHVFTGQMTLPPQDDVSMLEDPDAAMPDGDLWVTSKNPALAPAILDIWRWSSLQLTKTEVAENMATYGNCLLVVSELEDTQQVQIEVLHPAALTDVQFDRTNQVIVYAVVTTTDWEWVNGVKQSYKYQRIYTPTEFTTFRGGDLVSRGPNPHGFVPVELARFHPVTGDTWGLCAFAAALPAIHELNIGASVLGSNILMHQKPRWAVFGASAPAADEEISAAEDFLFFPAGSKADVLIPDLSIQDTYKHLETILAKLEDWYPELLLNQFGSGKRDVSGAGVRGLASGLIRRALACRERGEHSLKRAMQMAMTMGQNLGGTGINVFASSLGAYGSNELDFQFHWPDVLPLNRLERLRIAAEEKQLELQIVTQEAQIQYAREHGPEVLLQFKPLTQPGGLTAPATNAPGVPSQGAPAQ